jgi:16S rRNA processing protein RimM
LSGSLRLELGRVLRPVGLRGEMKILLSDDFWPEVLDSGGLGLEGPGPRKPVTVCGARPAGHCLVLAFAEVKKVEEAESFRDWILAFQGEGLDVPEPEQVRPFQVIGQRVRLKEGGELGEVEDLEMMPAQPLLKVRGSGRLYSIPFVEPILSRWEREEGWIEVDPPPGLLEIEG